MRPGVDLRPVPAAESVALVQGGAAPPEGLSWSSGYPTSDTVVALRMLARAYADLDRPIGTHPMWWLYQLVVWHGGALLVVGDAGFHGPPDEDGAVEIGYAVAPEWRGRGVATAGLARLLVRARQLGARTVLAEAVADNPASRAVLRANGLVITDPVGQPDRFVIEL